MPNFICTTCGTQHAESEQPPATCAVCVVGRVGQFLPPVTRLPRCVCQPPAEGGQRPAGPPPWTAAYLKYGCFETGSQPVSVSSFAARRGFWVRTRGSATRPLPAS